MTMLTLHDGRTFPPLRGGIKGGVNRRPESSRLNPAFDGGRP